MGEACLRAVNVTEKVGMGERTRIMTISEKHLLFSFKETQTQSEFNSFLKTRSHSALTTLMAQN